VLSTSCTVKYQLPADEGDDQVTGYQVEMMGGGGAEREWRGVEGEGSVEGLELVVERLTPCCQYWFRVAAVNRIGTGEFSPASESVTCLPQLDDESSVSSSALQRYFTDELTGFA